MNKSFQEKAEKEGFVHYFLVDLCNNGELYSIGIIGKLEKIKEYLYQRHQEVIHTATKEIPKRKNLAHKEIPCGVLISCSFYCDRCQSSARSKRVSRVDERYTVWNQN